MPPTLRSPPVKSMTVPCCWTSRTESSLYKVVSLQRLITLADDGLIQVCHQQQGDTMWHTPGIHEPVTPVSHKGWLTWRVQHMCLRWPKHYFPKWMSKYETKCNQYYSWLRTCVMSPVVLNECLWPNEDDNPNKQTSWLPPAWRKRGTWHSLQAHLALPRPLSQAWHTFYSSPNRECKPVHKSLPNEWLGGAGAGQ